MTAKIDYDELLRSNMDKAARLVKDLPEIEAAFLAGQISGMLIGKQGIKTAETGKNMKRETA